MGCSLHLHREPREHETSKQVEGRLFLAEKGAMEQPRLPVLGDRQPDAHQAKSELMVQNFIKGWGDRHIGQRNHEQDSGIFL